MGKRKRITFSLAEQDRIINNVYPRMRERLIRLIIKARPIWSIPHLRADLFNYEDVYKRIMPRKFYHGEILSCDSPEKLEALKEDAMRQKFLENLCRNYSDVKYVHDLIQSRFLPTGVLYGKMGDETAKVVFECKKGGEND